MSRIKCYITDDDEGAALLTLIRHRYAVTNRPVADSDWENNWRAYYKPIPVGERLLVVPEWESAEEDGRCVLRLDPGLMFGSGSHPTTKMCLAALQDYVPGARTVLDLGCGSGILGIGALVLGAESCVGCDIDPKAPDVVMSNAALNGIGPDRLGESGMMTSKTQRHSTASVPPVCGCIAAMFARMRGCAAVSERAMTSCLQTSFPTSSFRSLPTCAASCRITPCS